LTAANPLHIPTISITIAMQRRNIFGRIAHTNATMVDAKGCTEPEMTGFPTRKMRSPWKKVDFAKALNPA
jgi:hypothetical protein